MSAEEHIVQNPHNQTEVALDPVASAIPDPSLQPLDAPLSAPLNEDDDEDTIELDPHAIEAEQNLEMDASVAMDTSVPVTEMDTAEVTQDVEDTKKLTHSKSDSGLSGTSSSKKKRYNTSGTNI